MKTRNVRLYCMLVLCSLVLLGCGKKADESKSVSEIKAEAEKMSVSQLRSKAMDYKDAIMAKTGDIDKIKAKLKEIPLTEKLGSEAKELAADIEELGKSLSGLKERFQIYYNKLKEKGGDLSGLEI